jgi:hypothetical protein
MDTDGRRFTRWLLLWAFLGKRTLRPDDAGVVRGADHNGMTHRLHLEVPCPVPVP